MTKTIILLLALLSTSAHAENNKANYEIGANDGCQSGINDWLHPFKKDVDLYINDEYYKTGWNDAFVKCKADSDKMGKIINESFGW